LNWRQFLLDRFFRGCLARVSGCSVNPSPAAIFAAVSKVIVRSPFNQ
jgi:hypothetical protein